MPRQLITSALPYINGTKHLGNLIGSMLPADVYSRFLRQRGEEVLFICATDEHGTPAELAAAAAGLPTAEFCRSQYELQKQNYADFGLSFDYFGRSSSPQNADLTQQFAGQLTTRGLIEERETRQVYSIEDGRFLPDRYVIGTCPHCGYELARGDQCENCTRLLDPVDLIEPRSAVSGSTQLEIRTSKHLFLLQSKLSDDLRKWIDTKTDWPVIVTSIARKWLDEGLEDRGITRDLEWGVPVNRPGFENKVFYVWFDAPIEYIGATKEWADEAPDERDWRSWWSATDDVRYTQFMAKDNIPFHTISFPSTILGSGEPWKLVDYIKGFNWLNYYGGKFSTSRGVGIFMDAALEILPADYWRWYLIANAPESDDSSFTWELFAGAVNKDLADTLGNFVHRTLTFTSRRFGAAIPATPAPMDAELSEELSRHIREYTTNLAEMRFRKAAQELREVWSVGNAYLDRTAPWTLVKTNADAAAGVLSTAINLIRLFGVLSQPIIPHSSERILSALGLRPGNEWVGDNINQELSALPQGHAFTVPEVLFRKLTDEEIEGWKQRFGAHGA